VRAPVNHPARHINTSPYRGVRRFCLLLRWRHRHLIR